MGKKEKNEGGRPIKKLTEKEIVQIETMASYLNQDQIADYIGMARNTLNAIFKRDPVVFERYKKGKARAIANVSKGLIKIATEGNVTAQIFYLKTQAGWTENAELNELIKKVEALTNGVISAETED